MSEEVVDVIGRQYTNAVKKELSGLIAGLNDRVTRLEQSGGGGGLSAITVADIAWKKANDAIYAQLQSPDSPLALALAKVAAGGGISSEQLREELARALATVRIGLVIE